MKEFRDRIKEFKRVKAGKIRNCPWNWRTHSAEQKAALEGILGEVGIAGAQIVRELPDGNYMLIDGHLRLDTYPPGQKVPVIVLDVTEKEAKKLLACYDPLGGMAGKDGGKLAELLKKVDTKDAALSSLFSGLAEGVLDTEALELDIDDDGSGPEAGADDGGEEITPSHVRMVQLFLNTTTITEFEELARGLAKSFGTSNVTDTVMEALRRASRKAEGKKRPA